METSQVTEAGWIVVGLTSAAAVGALALTLLAPGEGRVATWATRYGLALTGANRPVVDGYLRRTRSLQIAGALLGWLSTPVYIGLVGQPFPLGDSWVVLAVVGYLVGAAIAELSILTKSRPDTAVRVATLFPRTLAGYLPGATRWALRAVPMVTLVLAVVYTVVPKDPARSVDPSVAFMVASSIVVVGLALVVDMFLRAIVARPQAALASDLLAADDAIRASSIQSLSAAAVALMLLTVGWAMVSLGGVIANREVSHVCTWLGMASDVGALIAWFGLGYARTWRVHRGAYLAGRR